MSDILVNVSYGEFIDKITILEVKLLMIPSNNLDKLKNLKTEYELLLTKYNEKKDFFDTIKEEKNKLFNLNITLWKIEDEIRSLEDRKQFNQDFIEVARSVYLYNDKRNFLKNEINKKLNCGFIEVKSYSDKHIVTNKKNIIIISNMGVGDLIITSSIVKYYDFDHNVVFIIPEKSIKTVSQILEGSTVKLVTINKTNDYNFEVNEIKRVLESYRNSTVKYDILPLGCHRSFFGLQPNNYNIVDAFYKMFYYNARLPYTSAKLGFHITRNLAAEHEVYTAFMNKYNLRFGSDYIIINDDSNRNLTIDTNLVRKDLPIIYLDKNKCNLFFDNLCSYLLLIEQATEFHSFDTSISWLVDYSQIKTQKFMHTYIKDIKDKNFFVNGWNRV